MPKKISKKRLKRIEKLAKDIIDDMDMDSLIEYARDRMAEHFPSLSKEEFDEEWDSYYDVKKIREN